MGEAKHVRGECAMCGKTDLLLPSVKVDRKAKSVTMEHLCRSCYLRACAPLSNGNTKIEEDKR